MNLETSSIRATITSATLSEMVNRLPEEEKPSCIFCKTSLVGSTMASLHYKSRIYWMCPSCLSKYFGKIMVVLEL